VPDLQTLASELRDEITRSTPVLRAFTDADASAGLGSRKWNRKELLGHLIDSAANNHQRIVRAQLADALVFPGYEQDSWVAAQRYRGRPWSELVDVWIAFNTQVASAIESVPAGKHATRCVIDAGEPVTLEFLMRDYLRHLRHHLAQF
jgi:hypothetical protein